MRYPKFLASLALTLFSLTGAATQAPPIARAEIDGLFKKLVASGCQFNRNGSWYSGAEAQSHLTKKLEYFENKDMIKTAEDFITHAASNSSSSGKAYQVKCGTTRAVESKLWMSDQLKVLRTSKLTN